MSAFVVMVPAILSGPAFAAAVAVAGAALGLQAIAAATRTSATSQAEQQIEDPVEVAVPNSHALAETLDEGDVQPLVGNGFKVLFTKNGRGECQMCVTGEGKSKAELEKLGRELLNRTAQQYAYQKLTVELKKKGFSMVQERVEEDQTIRLTVRKWS
jgi:hypothetical protein